MMLRGREAGFSVTTLGGGGVEFCATGSVSVGMLMVLFGSLGLLMSTLEPGAFVVAFVPAGGIFDDSRVLIDLEPSEDDLDVGCVDDFEFGGVLPGLVPAAPLLLLVLAARAAE